MWFSVFILCFIIFAGVILIMSVGLLRGRRVQGSCGGLSSMGIEKACSCDRPCSQRQREIDLENMTSIE
ncbi:MAG: (Na+)-NQR maturation NqrM [Alcaligenaceae bacterium]|nr:(Na+)-NQR maturation NqrM [Alcaligenaceae bacterium]